MTLCVAATVLVGSCLACRSGNPATTRPSVGPSTVHVGTVGGAPASSRPLKTTSRPETAARVATPKLPQRAAARATPPSEPGTFRLPSTTSPIVSGCGAVHAAKVGRVGVHGPQVQCPAA
jgi:hypothetical protein